MQNAAIRALNIDYVYVPFHVMPEDLAKAVEGIRALQIAGVNVTIPHKERIIDYLDEVSEYSREIGSVNTVINLNGVLKGDTTDGPGFIRSAETAWGDLGGCRTVILGAGGSAKAVAFALARIGCKIVVANRTYKRAVELVESLTAAFGNKGFEAVELEREELAGRLENADLLVNTTSVGMFPDVDGIPLPPDLLHPKLMVYDLVYNPVRTRLVDEAQSRGARAMTGLGMLVHQGALSLKMWTNLDPPIDVMEQAVIEHFEKATPSF
jgi:shikimate dehydrogenase